MKKEMPKGAVVGIIALAVAGVVFAFIQFGSGPREFPPPANVPKVIPNYVWQGMPEGQKADMRSKGFVPESEATPEQLAQVEAARKQGQSAPTGRN